MSLLAKLAPFVVGAMLFIWWTRRGRRGGGPPVSGAKVFACLAAGMALGLFSLWVLLNWQQVRVWPSGALWAVAAFGAAWVGVQLLASGVVQWLASLGR